MLGFQTDSLKTPRSPNPTGMNLMSTESYVKAWCLNSDPQFMVKLTATIENFKRKRVIYFSHFIPLLNKANEVKSLLTLSPCNSFSVFFIYHCQYLIWTALPFQAPYAYFYLCLLS